MTISGLDVHRSGMNSSALLKAHSTIANSQRSYLSGGSLAEWHLRRATVYRETKIVVSGGICLPSIVSPWGPVSLGAPVGTGG